VVFGGLIVTGLGIGAAALLSGPPSRSAKSPSPPVVLRSTSGVVTGIAQACAGPLYEPVAHLEVYRGDASLARAEVYRNVVPVARKNVPTDTTYRFVLPPGHYFLSNTGNTEIPQPFVLSAGRTVYLDVQNFCQ
jgi:hypothetical protein